ncbi:MAG: four helix bundle protein [Cyanothece sp. SIO1E1]|nr:four helix bundle protein [Cyanothece sp. SIO1E1]
MSKDFISTHHELLVYQVAIQAAMRIFELTLFFPDTEQSLLTEQILKSSRSVCANLAEAWQRRRYRGAFVAKLNEVEAEAAETQTWVEIAQLCCYLKPETGHDLQRQYSTILAATARLIQNADLWVISS